MNRVLKWVLENLKTKTPFIFVTLATAVITYLFSQIESLVLRIEYIFALLLFIGFVLSVFYFNELHKVDENFRKLESIPNDATMLNLEKRIIFDSQTNADQTAYIEAHETLHNNMDTEYNLFEIKISSSVFVPNFEDITIDKNGEPLKLRRDVVKPKLIEECRVINGSSTTTSVTKKFSLPLHIEPKETCNFHVSYRSKAFQKAVEGGTDWYQYEVKRFTERLLVEIQLQDGARKTFSLKPCDELEGDGQQKIFQVFDGSSERMKTTEAALKKIKAVPQFKQDKMIWILNSPKIGYKYRVYFRLVKRP